MTAPIIDLEILREQLQQETARLQEEEAARRRAQDAAWEEEERQSVPTAPIPLDPPRCTDLGNAWRFIEQHGKDVHHGGRERDQWQYWDGDEHAGYGRWAWDEDGTVDRKAKKTAASIYAEAAIAADDQMRKALAQHAARSESARGIAAMMTLAKTEPGVIVSQRMLDRDLWLLNCANGTINLKTGKRRAPHRNDLITKMVPTTYDPSAECPTWNTFLHRVMGGDQGRIDFLQRAVGYALTGSTQERCVFILHGSGRNGKSTFVETISAILGADYALRMPTETLMTRRGDAGVPNDLARLRGARFVSAAEAEDGNRLAEAKLKDLTGGDTITARFMRGEWFDFSPAFKVFLTTNHLPQIRGTDQAIWDRIRLIPFTERIPDEEVDPQLREKLLAESAGILAWAVQGCLEWQRQGLNPPTAVQRATAGYRADQDILGAWISDHCLVDPLAKCPARDLYAAYHAWADASGERALSQTAFGKRLTERGFTSAQIGKSRTRTWVGIGLLGGPADGPDPVSDRQGEHVSGVNTFERDIPNNSLTRDASLFSPKNAFKPVHHPQTCSPESKNGSESVPDEDFGASAPPLNDVPDMVRAAGETSKMGRTALQEAGQLLAEEARRRGRQPVPKPSEQPDPWAEYAPARAD